MSAETGCIVLAGGGTAGHVNPALAVAAALRARSPALGIVFVGTPDGLEARLVPEAGWPFHAVAAVPLQRRRLSANLRVPLVLGRGVWRVARLLRQRAASVAVTFGGYTCAPLAAAAGCLRTPLVVHEQNAVPGLANRIAARWATTVATSVPGATDRWPHPDRVVLTGNPVRPEIAAVDVSRDRPAAQAHYGLDPQRSTLLVFGGSQGARRLNDAVVASAGRWADPGRIQVLHATGPRQHAEVRAAWAAAGDTGLLVRCEPYIDRMELAYAAADLALCRAGASTLAELGVVGLPAVLVPYPHAAADEQSANAAAFAAAGAAVCVPDAALDPARLVAEAEPVLLDDARRAQMRAAARGLGHPDAADRVATLVLAHAGLPVPAAGQPTSDHEDPR